MIYIYHYQMDIDEIFETVSKDSSLLANIDIDELLKAIESDKTDYLDNKTMDDILDENIRVLTRLNQGPESASNLCNKLAGYRYVDNLSELHKGKYIRWIRNSDKKLTNGALVFDVKFYDNGSQILCKNMRHQMMQIKFDDCTIFQRLSTGEQLILMAYEHLRDLRRV
jgi:hypothetical protein